LTYLIINGKKVLQTIVIKQPNKQVMIHSIEMGIWQWLALFLCLPVGYFAGKMLAKLMIKASKFILIVALLALISVITFLTNLGIIELWGTLLFFASLAIGLCKVVFKEIKNSAIPDNRDEYTVLKNEED